MGIGPTSKTAVLIGSAALCILALLSYVILRAFGAEQPAIGILVTCVVGAVLVTLYAILVDHFAEGVNLRIETCKCEGLPQLFDTVYSSHYCVIHFDDSAQCNHKQFLQRMEPGHGLARNASTASLRNPHCSAACS